MFGYAKTEVLEHIRLIFGNCFKKRNLYGARVDTFLCQYFLFFKKCFMQKYIQKYVHVNTEHILTLITQVLKMDVDFERR